LTVSKMHVRKGDKVLVLSGKDKGKKGKVIAAIPSEGKVVVEGVNIVKKHAKASQRVQAGIHEQEAALNSAKVMVVCPNCQKATRIAKSVMKDGSRARVCKKCGESLDK